MEVIIPTLTTPGSLTRASTATFFNSSGVLSTAAIDVIRIGYNPLDLTLPPFAILEPASTNLLLNNTTLSTQTVSGLSSGSVYSLSFYGTGTITMSGGYVDSLVGTAVFPKRVSLAITPNTTSVTFTVTGTVQYAQLELGGNVSSIIITSGSSVTRAADITVNGLLFSNIPETDYAFWSSTTTYAIGNRVIYNHYIYESLVASNTNKQPDTNSASWLLISPTNRYAMFDGQVGTISSQANNITVVIKNGIVNGLSFMQMNAAKAQVSLADSGGNVVYTATLDLSSGVILDWYSYFNTPIVRVTDYALNDIPSFLSGVLTVVISSPSSTVSCGNLVSGTIVSLGTTLSSPTVGIVDYSVKSIDAFGNPTIIKRAYSKRMDAKMILTAVQVDYIATQLANIRSTPCVWIGAGNIFTSLIVYGYYKDFSIDIAYPNTAYCTLQIEGVI
jgi:hypothetical protein